MCSFVSAGNVQSISEEIEDSLAADHHRPRMRDLLDEKTGRVRSLVWVAIGLASFQQLVGINVVFYYGAVLWQSVGFSESDALLINVLSGGLSIVACLVTVYFIDRVGRKPLLLIGFRRGAVVAQFSSPGRLSADRGGPAVIEEPPARWFRT